MDGQGNDEVGWWRAEAARWEAEATRLAEVNVGLRAELVEAQGQVTALVEQVVTLTRLLFGDSSEKQPGKENKPEKSDAASDDDGGEGAGPDGGQGGGGKGGSASGGRRGRGQQPGSSGHGRRDYSDLDTVVEVHELDEDGRSCTGCGTGYATLGFEDSEQIDWQVRLVRIVHRRRRYRRGCDCEAPGTLIAPVPAKPIPKGRFTAGFLARLLVEKQVLGRPVHRIAAALAHEGFDVASGTLVGALQACSGLLGPVDEAIRARNAAAGHLHVDETSWKVFEPVAGKANNRWWLWVFAAADTTVFTIEPSRSTKVAADHLGIDVDVGSLEAGRRLLVSSDFFTVYQALAKVEGVEPLWCWAHIRRYFIRARDAHPALAGWTAVWLGRIGTRYSAHQTLNQAVVGSVEATAAQADFEAALEVMDTARHRETADPGLHPAAVKVLATLDREWDGLARHADFPELALDNNTAERGLRNPVVGRKNYYGCGAVWSAVLAGRLWTVTTTASQADHNPLVWLEDYLDACAGAGGRPPGHHTLAGLAPWIGPESDQATKAGKPTGAATVGGRSP